MPRVEAINGQTIDPSSGWFSAQELSGLPGLPGTDRGVKKAAEKNLWSARSKERGKGTEYAITALPAPTREYLSRLAHDFISSLPEPIAQPPAETPQQPLKKTLPRPLPAHAVAARGQIRKMVADNALTDSGRHYRDAALILCQAVDDAMHTAGCSERRACEALAQRLVAGDAHPRLLEAARATYLKPRNAPADEAAPGGLGGLGSVSAQAARLARMRAFFERGRLVGDPGAYLAPSARPAIGHHPMQVAAFLRFFCRPSRPTIAEAHRAMAPWLAEHGLPMPSYATVARIQQDLPVTVKYRGRVTGSAWRSLQPYVDRDLSAFKANDLWVGDGHSFKAKVQHPIHGQPFTPEVTVIIDWVSRKAVGWSVSLSESTVAVSDAFRHAQTVTRARPLVYYSDNGAGQTGKKIDAPITGTLVRQGVAHHTGIPGNPQGRGIIERLWQSTLIPLARSYATCTWRGADENHTTKVIKLMARKDGGGIAIPSFRQLLDDIARVLSDYNLHHPHSALAKAGGDGTPEGTYQARLDRDSLVFGPTDSEIATLWMPEVIRSPSRGVVQLFGNAYARRDLVGLLAEGAKVRVRYDLHDASKVWLLDMDGRMIGEATWNGNAKAAFPVPEIDRLRAIRAAGKVKRGEEIIAEAQAELGEVFEAAGIEPAPVPVADYLPVAPIDADGAEENAAAAPAAMSHADLVMWLYGQSAGAEEAETDGAGTVAGPVHQQAAG